MFTKPWRFSILCVICFCNLNGNNGQRRYPWRLFHNSNRRILNGVDASVTRPYMVYLRADPELASTRPNWLCGGVIIHEFFVLTSAACIEDIKRFYVVSGTYNWVPGTDESNECIKNGAVRAVWKCVPKSRKRKKSNYLISTDPTEMTRQADSFAGKLRSNRPSYVYDGKQFDNIRWMMYDLAIVRVEEPFNFQKRVRGCDFIPTLIRYNNISEALEKPGTVGSIAGWGSTKGFNKKEKTLTSTPNSTNTRAEENSENSDNPENSETTTKPTNTGNSPVLLETDVLLISKKKCKSRWPAQHHAIIDQHMICAKSTDSKALGSLCMENDLNCKDIVYEEYEEKEEEGEGGGTAAPDGDVNEKPDEAADEKPESETTAATGETSIPEIPEETPETDNTRRFGDEHDVIVHGANHVSESQYYKDGRRGGGGKYGGFCENDHGGPLLVGRGKEAVVVGIISACMSKSRTHECYGPFLFTSIFRYKHLIACATEKVEGAQHTSHACRNALRSTKTELKRVRFDWASSKRLMSAEDFVNSKVVDMASNEDTSLEKTRKQITIDTSHEENSKPVALDGNRRGNPLYEGVREIGEDGQPVPDEDVPTKDLIEPKNWKKDRKRAREARARLALGFPVTDTVGQTTVSTISTTTEKDFPVVTYAVDSASNFHDVDGHEPENDIKKRKNSERNLTVL